MWSLWHKAEYLSIVIGTLLIIAMGCAEGQKAGGTSEIVANPHPTAIPQIIPTPGSDNIVVVDNVLTVEAILGTPTPKPTRVPTSAAPSQSKASTVKTCDRFARMLFDLGNQDIRTAEEVKEIVQSIYLSDAQTADPWVKLQLGVLLIDLSTDGNYENVWRVNEACASWYK